MISEGYLARHYQGRKGGRAPALLDVAQDYALKIISDSGLFTMGLAFKGGTALRKYRVGTAGRFSTDLDFSAEEEGIGDLLFEALDGKELYDVRFSVEVDSPGRRGRLNIDSPLGRPEIKAKIEVTMRAPWFPPQWTDPIPFSVHKAYEFPPVRTPIMALEESLAEKLAAFRRRALVRDLYDLGLFHTGSFNENLVRELTYLKVFMDVVEEGLGVGPFEPIEDILRPRNASEFLPENIGILTGKVNISLWLEKVHSRFDFLRNKTEEQKRWSQCNLKDAYEVRKVIQSFRS